MCLGRFENGSKVNGLIGSFSLKDKAASQLLTFYSQNPSATLFNMLSVILRDSVGRIKLNNTLLKIADELSQYISTSLVVVTTSASRATSASGKFVEKSLKGVRNKLKNVQDSKECQAVLISWARTLVEADVVSVVETDFYLNLTAALQSTPAAGPPAAAKKAKRADSSVESTSTG